MGSAAENGIAVYKFADVEVAPERFITIPAQGEQRIGSHANHLQV
jgi:hypothetical protein